MPPKRRNSAGPASESAPTKRVTRSSSKADQITVRLSPSDSKDATSTSSKVEKKARSKTGKSTKPKVSDQDIKPNLDDEASKYKTAAPSHNTTTLTITSTLVKSPIKCHHYASPTASTSPPPILIFTHGAGGTLSAPAITNFCTGFSPSHSVLVFQGSMNLKARTKSFHACIQHLSDQPETSKTATSALLFGGRSMGARAAVIAATETLQQRGASSSAEEVPIRLILISYPLVGPKSDLRDQILLDLPPSVGVLFIIGDRDAMCPLDVLNETRAKMAAKGQLVVVRGADHGMHVKPARREKGVGEKTGRVAGEWVGGGVEEEVVYVGGEEDEEEEE